LNKELHHFHALSPRKTKNIYLDVGVPKFDSQYFSFVLIQQKKMVTGNGITLFLCNSAQSGNAEHHLWIFFSLTLSVMLVL
jgi:hypothetical protein